MDKQNIIRTQTQGIPVSASVVSHLLKKQSQVRINPLKSLERAISDSPISQSSSPKLLSDSSEDDSSPKLITYSPPSPTILKSLEKQRYKYMNSYTQKKINIYSVNKH